jgi:hypothetical protein
VGDVYLRHVCHPYHRLAPLHPLLLCTGTGSNYGGHGQERAINVSLTAFKYLWMQAHGNAAIAAAGDVAHYQELFVLKNMEEPGKLAAWCAEHPGHPGLNVESFTARVRCYAWSNSCLQGNATALVHLVRASLMVGGTVTPTPICRHCPPPTLSLLCALFPAPAWRGRRGEGNEQWGRVSLAAL